MKAMILAAGEGMRLRPLTISRPKPMVPVANKPNISHVLDKLAHAGIKEAAINLYSYPRQIKSYVGRGKPWGLNIFYSQEKDLSGTAGSLAPLRNFFKDETFAVLSGDGVSDINLIELEAFHKRHRALATLVLVRNDARFDYGLVRLNGDHQVAGFIEKPSWSEAFAPYINSGIYMMEPEVLKWIPDGEPFDFARDLWPRLMAEGKKLCGYVFGGYWCDIGNLKEYRRCHRDILEGRANIKISGTQIEPNVWVGEKTRIAKGVILRGPIVIGDGAVIGKNAKIMPYSFIGDYCRIGGGAVVEESILWKCVTIAKGVRVSGCVLADGTRLKESVSFFEGAILSV